MANHSLNKQQIQKGIKQPLEIILLEETTSTNDVAKERLKESKQPLLVATNKQTAGRGRLGRSFYSELAHGLYFSLAFHPQNVAIEEMPQYTLLAAATLVETLEEMTGKPLAIKWVNDIFYNGRKISGILSEMISADKTGVIIGIGLNFAGEFTHTAKEVQQVAGTLFGEKIPETFNQNAFLNAFIQRFLSYHTEFQEKAFLPVYETHLLGIGEEVTYFIQEEKYFGTILGISEQGHLRVRKADGTLETLYSQEVHFNSRQFLH